jgi:hypothetical protein
MSVGLKHLHGILFIIDHVFVMLRHVTVSNGLIKKKQFEVTWLLSLRPWMHVLLHVVRYSVLKRLRIINSKERQFGEEFYSSEVKHQL